MAGFSGNLSLINTLIVCKMKTKLLFNTDGDLVLPKVLSEIYLDQLTRMGKLKFASEYRRDENTDGPIGGEGVEDTEIHFAQRFSNSCARLQYLIIDPELDFGIVPECVLRSFATGKIGLLDAPCGTGAGSLSLLHTLCSLREESLLPSLPLDVNIIAADYSESALAIYRDMMSSSLEEFSRYNITVSIESTLWDAKDIGSTCQLMSDFRSNDCDEFFIMVSAFSGIGDEGFTEIDASLRHMQSVLSNDKFTLIHVEPNTKKAKRFFKIIKDYVFSIFKGKHTSEEYIKSRRFSWLDPVNNNVVQSNVMVHLNTKGNG